MNDPVDELVGAAEEVREGDSYFLLVLMVPSQRPTMI
jgi:hypothetical protein